MSEELKSIIRHALTTVGVLLGLLGLNQYVPIVDYLLSILDSVWSAIALISGIVITIIGFFRNRERFETLRAKAK